jgi:hypothetical protein
MRISTTQVFGLVLVVLGLGFLLRNAGIADLDWGSLFPILLVVLGLVVLLAALAGRSIGRNHVAVPRGPRELELDLTVAAGRFRISGGANDLVEVSSTDDDVRWTTDRRGDRGRIRIRQDAAWSPWRWGRGAEWDLRLASDVPTALDVTVGAGRVDVDLVDVRVVGAHLSLGAASGSLRLPRPVGDVRIEVALGAASLRVGVPSGVEARVTTGGGLMSVTGERETPGWGRAANRVSVSISGGASSVRIVPA